MYVTRQQRYAANRIDLARWLNTHHPADVRQEGDSVLLRANSHVSVKSGYSGYQDWRTGETGNNVDYLMHYLGYSYPDAVAALLGLDDRPNCQSTPMEHSPALPPVKTGPSTKAIDLPSPASIMPNVYAYLSARGIPKTAIDTLVRHHLLYQSENGNNAVFVSPQHDYCEIRGTNTYADRRCRHRDDCARYAADKHQWCLHEQGCDQYKKSSFHGCRKTSPDRFWYFTVGSKPYSHIYICEAAIDAVSLYVLHRGHGIDESAVYVSIGGVANQKAIDRIKHQCDHVVIATDNDPAGDACRERNAELETIRPCGKDWNADLMARVYYADQAD